MQGLCCLDVQGQGAIVMVRDFIEDSKEPGETLRAAEQMIEECFDNSEGCDELLARHARHWELSRLALVDRNILRLAVHELLAGKTPPKVVISEALRLGQEFSSAESPRFINGVLDAVLKELENKKAES